MGHLGGSQSFWVFWDKIPIQTKLKPKKDAGWLTELGSTKVAPWIHMLSSELSLFQFFSLSLSLYLAFCFSMEGLPLCGCVKVVRVMGIEKARVTYNVTLLVAITEAKEILSFSGFAYKKNSGQGSDWSSLDHMHIPGPIRIVREMESCGWPGLDYCLSLKGVVGKCMIDS